MKKCSIVECKFLDHVEDGDEPIEFIVHGLLVKKKKEYIVISSWSYSDKKFRDDGNEKLFTIVRSAIVQLRKLN